MSEANKPAFPVLDAHLEEGLTKREYYAAKAMQALITACAGDPHCAPWEAVKGDVNRNDTALTSFLMADAMLSETERRNDMLALAEQVAELPPVGRPLVLEGLVDEARRILGRSE